MLNANGVIKCVKEVKTRDEIKIFREDKMYRYWKETDNYVACDDMNQLHIIYREGQSDLDKFFSDHFEIVS